MKAVQHHMRVPNRVRARLNSAKHLVGLAIAELRRLNHARMDAAALAKLSRTERTKIVKATLAEHHHGPNRCC